MNLKTIQSFIKGDTTMKNRTIHGNYFYGNEISTYGKENGYVDYRTLGKAFNMVLNNEIRNRTYGIGYWEIINGFIDNSDEIEKLEEKIEKHEEIIKGIKLDFSRYPNDYFLQEQIDEEEKEIEQLKADIEELEDEQENIPEIYQYYIIDSWGAEILENWTDEIVFYNEELDMYIWGVTHWGTSWDYVLTDIKIDKGE